MIALLLAATLATAASAAPAARILPEPIVPIRNPQPAAIDLLRCLSGQGVTLTSGHRGGPEPGFPENALETAAHTLAKAPMLIELDVRTTRDGVLVLLHDADVKRTTTGEGPVRDLDWAAVQALRLEDSQGAATPFPATTLQEALTWMRGRGLLVIDLKEYASIPAIARAVAEADARAYAIVNVYTPTQARAFHRIDPGLTLVHPVSTLADLEVLELVGVNLDRLVAWTGIYGIDEDRAELWRALRARRMPVIHATLYVGDREASAELRQTLARNLASGGVDIIPTDRHLETFGVLDARRSTAAGLAVCGAAPPAAATTTAH